MDTLSASLPLPCDDVIKVRDLYKDELSVVCDPNIDNYFFTPLKTANEKGTGFYRTIGEGKADDGLWLMKDYSIAHHLRKDVKDEFRNHVLCRIKRTPRKKPLMILPLVMRRRVRRRRSRKTRFFSLNCREKMA